MTWPIRQLMQALRTPEAYAILDGCGQRLTFMAGGCWLLAEALRRVLGGRLHAVYRQGGLLDHVVLRLDEDAYLDADGLHTQAQMLQKMKEVEGVTAPLALGVFDPARAGEITYDESTVARLAEFLAGVRRKGQTMGSLYTEKAGQALKAIAGACHAQQKERHEPSSNVFWANEKRYFYQVSCRQQKDGGISGSVWLCLENDQVRQVGTFRIAGNGKLVRGPALFK